MSVVSVSLHCLEFLSSAFCSFQSLLTSLVKFISSYFIIFGVIVNRTFFFKILFLSNLYPQHGVWTHSPKINSPMLFRQPIRRPGTVFLISLSAASLFLYRNATYFFILIFVSWTLVNSFISSSNYLVETLLFSIYVASCRLQIVTILLIPYEFGCLLFLFVIWLL